jgi:hypothetical protein
MDYTPGPWKVKDGWDKNGNGKYFPEVVFCETPKLKGVVVNESHNQEAESIMANAYLIAAAPELLEALERLAGDIEDLGAEYDYSTMSMVRAAIAKAHGELS